LGREPGLGTARCDRAAQLQRACRGPTCRTLGPGPLLGALVHQPAGAGAAAAVARTAAGRGNPAVVLRGASGAGWAALRRARGPAPRRGAGFSGLRSDDRMPSIAPAPRSAECSGSSSPSSTLSAFRIAGSPATPAASPCSRTSPRTGSRVSALSPPLSMLPARSCSPLVSPDCTPQVRRAARRTVTEECRQGAREDIPVRLLPAPLHFPLLSPCVLVLCVCRRSRATPRSLRPRALTLLRARAQALPACPPTSRPACATRCKLRRTGLCERLVVLWARVPVVCCADWRMRRPSRTLVAARSCCGGSGFAAGGRGWGFGARADSGA